MTAQPTAAIITLYGLFNYGNRLQNYAVTRNLFERGWRPETLIVKTNYPQQTVRDLALKVGHNLGLRGEISKKYKNFAEFDRLIPTRRVWSEKQLQSLGQKYDAALVGSDQIWNSYRIHRGGAEFADFVEPHRRIAISPSFGVTDVEAARQKEFASALNNFASLSVREFSGAQIIEELTGRHAPVILDPTMSLPAEHWRNLAQTTMAPDQPYIFIYLLGDYPQQVWDEVFGYAKKKGLVPVVLMRKDMLEYFAAGPRDFLGLLDGAEEVIGDSFHAAVFALLFDQPYHVVERTDRKSMTTRFDTLQIHFGFDLVEDPDLPSGKKIQVDQTKFNDKLQSLQQEYAAYLDQALAAIRPVL